MAYKRLQRQRLQTYRISYNLSHYRSLSSYLIRRLHLHIHLSIPSHSYFLGYNRSMLSLYCVIVDPKREIIWFLTSHASASEIMLALTLSDDTNGIQAL